MVIRSEKGCVVVMLVVLALLAGCSKESPEAVGKKDAWILEITEENCAKKRITELMEDFGETVGRAVGSACFRSTPFVYYSPATSTINPILVNEESCTPEALAQYKHIQGWEKLSAACINPDWRRRGAAVKSTGRTW